MMSDRSKRAPINTRDLPSTAHGRSLFRLRAILTSLIICIGGLLTFLVWTLPHLSELATPAPTPLTYIIVFSPTLIMMLVLLLGFMIWWVGIDYGWWGGVFTSRAEVKRTSAFPDAKQSQHERGKVNSRRLHVRGTTAAMLQVQRKRRLYEGRAYKGKTRQADLARFSPSPSQISALSPLSHDATAPMAVPDDSSEAQPSEVAAATVGLSLSLLTEMPPSSASESISLTNNTEAMPVQLPPVALYMLKEVTVEVQNAEGKKRTVELRRKRREDGKYIERELLAYLACRRGQPVARDKLLEEVFGYGLSDEKYSLTNLTNQFNKCTQFLRQDINKVASELGIPTLTIISSTRDEWRLLTEECRVVDLDEVERLYGLIGAASGETCLQPTVQDACQALIDVYKGDFLESYVEETVREGGADWVNSWIRYPYAAYRTKYFHALWYRAEYWRIKGDLCTGTSDAERALQRNWYEQAAKLYRDYALHVTTNFTHESAMLFDLETRQRISLGERALRASLDMYAATKNTQAGDTVYLTFARRMEALTQGRWRPHPDTVQAWKNVKEQTKSHRFAPRVTPHDLPQEEKEE